LLLLVSLFWYGLALKPPTRFGDVTKFLVETVRPRVFVCLSIILAFGYSFAGTLPGSPEPGVLVVGVFIFLMLFGHFVLVVFRFCRPKNYLDELGDKSKAWQKLNSYIDIKERHEKTIKLITARLRRRYLEVTFERLEPDKLNVCVEPQPANHGGVMWRAKDANKYFIPAKHTMLLNIDENMHPLICSQIARELCIHIRQTTSSGSYVDPPNA